MGCVSGKPSKEEEARERRDREVLAPPERGDECHFHIQREPRGNRFKFLKGGGDFNGDPRTYPLWLKCEREGEFGQNERFALRTLGDREEDGGDGRGGELLFRAVVVEPPTYRYDNVSSLDVVPGRDSWSEDEADAAPQPPKNLDGKTDHMGITRRACWKMSCKVEIKEPEEKPGGKKVEWIYQSDEESDRKDLSRMNTAATLSVEAWGRAKRDDVTFIGKDDFFIKEERARARLGPLRRRIDGYKCTLAVIPPQLRSAHSSGPPPEWLAASRASRRSRRMASRNSKGSADDGDSERSRYGRPKRTRSRFASTNMRGASFSSTGPAGHSIREGAGGGPRASSRSRAESGLDEAEVVVDSREVARMARDSRKAAREKATERMPVKVRGDWEGSTAAELAGRETRFECSLFKAQATQDGMDARTRRADVLVRPSNKYKPTLGGMAALLCSVMVAPADVAAKVEPPFPDVRQVEATYEGATGKWLDRDEEESPDE